MKTMTRVLRTGVRDAALASSLLALLLGITPSASFAAKPMAGFRVADAEAERTRETEAAQTLSADTLRKHLRILTAEPHVAGTPADLKTAEYVRDRLAAYGWSAKIESIPVYLNYPLEARLELVEPTREPLRLRELGVEGDKDSYDSQVFDAFHGYAASGDVTAPVVYANYGDRDDLKKLAELGVDVRGKIVLVRYGKIFRGLKVRNAERAGAAAVVIYSDPEDDGYTRGDVYPRGTARPPDAIQRGSVQFLSEGPGDPTTPGWPSRQGGKRLAPAEAKGIPHIPSIPIAWAEAEKILAALGGPVAPSGWQGAVPVTYHVGEGPARLHLVTKQDYAVRPIWNVIATLQGREHPEQWVVCGNHRDAWAHGAIDPNSGTITMLETARAIGALVKSGWRPRRTIVLGSWDGEEYGLLGSTEWCEAHADELGTKSVAYINIDSAVGGTDFRTNGCHALRDVLVEAMEDVTVPGQPLTTLATWRNKAWSEGKSEWAKKNRERRWRHEPERPFELNVSPLGSGSDYTTFVDHLGIPAIDLRFEGLQGTYHSAYDDFEYLDGIVDPGYRYHVGMANLWTRLTLRLAESEVVPLRYSNTGQFVLDELQSLADRIEDANVGNDVDSTKLVADLAPLTEAATRLRDAAARVESRATSMLAGGGSSSAEVARINAALMSVERALLGPGLPGRTWFRHEIYAPGLDTGYAPVPLPRIGQAVLDRDRKALASGVAPIRDALLRATAALEKAAP